MDSFHLVLVALPRKKCLVRDIGLIRKKYRINQGIVIIKDNGNKNNEKVTQAYKLFSEGTEPVDVSEGI
jgi:hypothetical protein